MKKIQKKVDKSHFGVYNSEHKGKGVFKGVTSLKASFSFFTDFLPIKRRKTNVVCRRDNRAGY